MFTRSTTLTNGIVIDDNRALSAGITIRHGIRKYVELKYSSVSGFFVNVFPCWLNTTEEINNIMAELKKMEAARLEAEEFINQ